MCPRFVRGVTLTPEERQRIGLYGPPHGYEQFDPSTASSTAATSSASPATERSSRSRLVRSWSGDVEMPDGNRCHVTYQRLGPRAHRFYYEHPVREQRWYSDLLEGGEGAEDAEDAIESKAHELAPGAFEQARVHEQERMRRILVPQGWRMPPEGVGRLKTKTAKELAGRYALCLRFLSGSLLPVGSAHLHPDAVVAEYESRQHSDILPCSHRYVVGICCRWQRRWIEPEFLTHNQRLPGALEENADIETDAETNLHTDVDIIAETTASTDIETVPGIAIETVPGIPFAPQEGDEDPEDDSELVAA